MAILLIDDSTFILKQHQQMIENTGYDQPIYATADGGEAIRMSLSYAEDLDLILLDINMPSVNGLDVLRSIKENPVTQKIPVLMVTTETSKSAIQLAGQTGAMGYVLKPLKQDVLASKLTKALALSPRLLK